jgi:hypothetical protein
MDVKKTKGLTLKVLVIGILLSFLGAFWVGTQEIQGWYDSRNTDYFNVKLWIPIGTAWFMMIAIQLINRATGRKIFTKQEIVMIMIIASLCFAPFDWGVYHSSNMAGVAVLYQQSEERQSFVKEVLTLVGGNGLFPRFNDNNYWEAVGIGSLAGPNPYVTPDFSIWSQYIIWDGLHFGLFILLGFFLMMLFRRTIVDVENMPFPWGDLCMEIADETESLFAKVKEKKFSIYFGIALLISWVWYTIPMIDLWKWLFTGVNADVVVRGSLATIGLGSFMPFETAGANDPTHLGLQFLPWVMLFITIQLPYLGWYHLLSLEVLSGFLVGYLLFFVIYPIVMTGAGRMPDWIAGVGADSRGILRALIDPNYGNIGPIYIGLALGLAIMIIWRNKGTFKQILSAIGGTKVSKDVDPDPPTPYRYVWWGLIAIFIVFVLNDVTFGLPAIGVILHNLAWIPQLIAYGVMTGTSGGNIGGMFGWGWGPHSFWNEPIQAAFATAGSALPADTVAWAKNIVEWGLFKWLYGQNWSIPQDHWVGMVVSYVYGAIICLWAFYLAKRANIPNKDVLLAAVIFAPLTAFLNAIAWITRLYAININYDFWSWEWGNGNRAFIAMEQVLQGQWYNAANSPGISLLLRPTESVIMIILGAVLIIVFYILRERLTWFRIHPVGVFLAVSFPQMWVPVLLNYVIKTVIFKVNPALYDRISKPLAIGLVFGWMIVMTNYYFLAALYTWRSATGLYWGG